MYEVIYTGQFSTEKECTLFEKTNGHRWIDDIKRLIQSKRKQEICLRFSSFDKEIKRASMDHAERKQR